MTEPEFTMTATHLARTMEAVRKRERSRAARLIEDQADVVLGSGEEAAVRISDILRAVAGLVRDNSREDVPAAPPVADPVERVWRDESSAQEPARVGNAHVIADDTGLAPVRIMDDFDEGSAMVRNLSARGRLNLPRD